MDELKKWFEFVVNGTGGDARSALLALERVVLDGEAISDIEAENDDDWPFLHEDMIAYMHRFTDILFEPRANGSGHETFLWFKRADETDGRDLILWRGMAKVEWFNMTPDIAKMLLAGEPINIEPPDDAFDEYVFVLRLAFDPARLLAQMLTVGERLNYYVGGDDLTEMED